jgi:hypothetical protein
MRVAIITNINKPKVRPALADLIPWVQQRVQVMGVETDSPLDLGRCFPRPGASRAGACP